MENTVRSSAQKDRNKYKKVYAARLKNRFNSDIIIGDVINEEEIDGVRYFVVRASRGNIIKLSKEAYSLQRG